MRTIRPTTLLIERTVDQAGERIKIDGITIGGKTRFDQFARRRIVEIELPLQNGAQRVALGRRFLAVDVGDMNQQGGRREAIVIVVETGRGLFAAADLAEKILQ